MKIVALATAGVLALTLAACGSDEPTPTAEPSSTPPTSATSATSTAADVTDSVSPASYTGTWLVHGGRLVVKDDHSAHASHVSSCPAAWASATQCTQEMDLKWTEDGPALRLLVLDVWVTDGTRRQFPDPPPPMSAGSFYTTTLRDDGSATTRLQNDDGAVAGANGLGNPHLCRPHSDALANGVCGA